MEGQVHRLVEKTWAKFQNLDDSKRLLIGLSGIPGSGKTTLAALVVAGINKTYHANYYKRFPNTPEPSSERPNPSQPNIAVVVPLDGFHLSRKKLSAMPNPEEAHFRRGAAFTFDAQGYLKLVEKLREPLEAATPTIHAPSFDHAEKDPVEDAIAIPSTARIIVLEGLYIAMDRDGWRDAAELMDELWYIETPFPIAEARVAKRNFAAGISPTLADSLARTKASDMRNGREVAAERLPVQEIIRSVEDDRWKNEEMERAEKVIEEEQEETQERPRMGRQDRMDSIAELTASGAGW